jgi:hypothetical protein
MTSPSKWSLLIFLSFVRIYICFRAHYMPHPFLCRWFDYQNNVWRRVQIMKLLLMLAVFPVLLLHTLAPVQIFSSAPSLFSDTLNLCSLYIGDQVSHPQKLHPRAVYIVSFMVLDSRWDDRRFWTEWLQALPEFNLLMISSWMQF